MLAERLEDRTLFNVIAINGTSGNDTINVTSSRVFLFTVVNYTVNGTPGSAVVGTGDTVLVNSGSGQDTVNILSTVVPTDVTGNAVPGSEDTLNIGDASGVQNITAPLQSENPSGFWNINVNNGPDTGARTETIGSTTIASAAYGQITGIAPAPIDYKYADTDNVVVSTGGGADTVNVLATGGVGYTWLQSGADAVVNVGLGNTRSINSQLVIENSPAFDTLTVDDSADTTARTITLDTVLFSPAPDGDTFERIQGLAPNAILFEWKDLSNSNPTTILAGSGGNTVAIASLDPDSAARTINLFTGAGNDVTTVDDVGTAATLNIHGQNGSDAVTVPAAAAQLIAGTLSVDNTVSTTALTVDDSTDATARTVTLDTFVNNGATNWERITGLTPGTIQYQGLDVTAPTIKGGTGGNTFNVLHTPGFFSGAPSKTLTLDTGTGNDVVNVHNTAASGTLLVNGQTGLDTVNLGDASSLQGIFGPVNIQNPGDFSTVTADDSADTTAQTVTLDTFASGGGIWQSIAGLAPALISYNGNDVSGPTIEGGSGGNTFTVVHTTSFNSIAASKVLTLVTGRGADTTDVQSTALNSTLLIDGQNGADTVNLGDTNGVQDINGAVNIQDHPSFVTVTADDSADATARTVTLDTFVNGTDIWQSITGLAPAAISYDGNDASAPTIKGGSGGNTITVVHTTSFNGAASSKVLTLDTGTGADTTDVQSTASNSTLLIDGLSGLDTVNLGDGSGVQDINGPVNIQNHPRFTTITADDSPDTTARTVTLDTFVNGTDTWQSITGLAPAVISYDGNDASGPTIKGGSGGNTFTVAHTTAFNVVAPVQLLTLQSGAGSDTVLVSGASAPLSILGQAGNDSVNLNFAGITSNLTVDGGAGINTLTLQGAAPTDAFTVTAATVTHGTVIVDYASIQTLVLDPGAFTVTADLAGLNVITAGAGTTALFTTTQHLGGLEVDAGTKATLQSSPAPVGKTIFCTGLVVSASGALDLANNALQLNYGALPDPIATVRALVTSGYNGGTWTGHGINSSSAGANHALGFGDAADGAVLGLPAHNILVRFTRYGDVNLDGSVGFADLLLLAQHYGQSGQNWDQGDLTYDGAVGFPDLLKLAQNYGTTAAVAFPAAAASDLATITLASRRRVALPA